MEFSPIIGETWQAKVQQCLIEMDRKLDIVVEYVNEEPCCQEEEEAPAEEDVETKDDDVEVAVIVNDLNAAEGLDAIEIDFGCKPMEELHSPDDFLLFYDQAQNRATRRRANQRTVTRRARQKRRLCDTYQDRCDCNDLAHHSGSDAGRAPVIDEIAPAEHAQDATKANWNSKSPHILWKG